MQRLVDAINLISKIFVIGSLALLSVISFAQVVSRFVLNHSIFWSEEVCRYGLVWITMIGASLLINTNRMIAMTFIVHKLPQNIQRIMSIFFNMVVNLFLILLIYGGTKLVLKTTAQVSVSTGISMGLIYAIVPIGCFFMLVNSVYLTIQEIRK